MHADQETATHAAATVVLEVAGMHCGSCVALIEETLLEDLGVLRARVELESSLATVTYDPTTHSVDDVCAAVAAAGYAARPTEAPAAEAGGRTD